MEARRLRSIRPDLIISGGFPWLIPEDVVALPRFGAINLHPAPLPKYRGPAAVEWAFRNGDPEMGFTVHRISNTFDGGAILAQGSMPIEDEDDAGTLMMRMGQLVPPLLAQALGRIARGEYGDPQDETAASYAGALDLDWRSIDWHKSARTIHNQVRSWTGIRDVPKGALGVIEGEKLVILKTRLTAGGGDEDALVPAGHVIVRDQDRLVVQCGDGPLEILAWSPSGS
jgi:methionyl-tRNA formyltransferase